MATFELMEKMAPNAVIKVVGNPVHASGVGLLLMGSQIEHPRRPVIPAGRAVGLFNKLKNWYRGEF